MYCNFRVLLRPLQSEKYSRIVYAHNILLGLHAVSPEVFRLTTTLSNSQPIDSTKILMAVGLSKAEPLAAAHERDMVQWRDMVASTPTWLGGQLLIILPADRILEQCSAKTAAMTSSSVTTGDDGDMEENDHNSKSKLASSWSSSVRSRGGGSSEAVKKMKTTSAKFFGTINTSKPTTRKVEPQMDPADQKSTSTSSSTSKPSKTISTPTVPTVAHQEKENLIRTNQVLRATMQKSDGHHYVGTADDFVGDMDDDDNDEDDDDKDKNEGNSTDRPFINAPRKKTSSTPVQSSPTKNETQSTASPTSPVQGATNAFENTNALPQHSTPATSNYNGNSERKQRKRRKRLVEKTFLQNGYLRTETQAIWEDVTSDEETEESKACAVLSKKPVPASTKPKNLQHMKQKSLMGFFNKK